LSRSLSTRRNIASFIDQAILRADLTERQVVELCKRSIGYEFAAVCVHPIHVAFAASALSGSEIRVASVVGFPLGSSTTQVKAFEAGTAENEGATEIDMVLSLSLIKDADMEAAGKDIHEVRRALSQSTTLKVILECPLLSDPEKVTFASLAAESGADYVKTGTGTRGNATEKDVELLYRAVKGKASIKAAGGIADLRATLAMIEAGASRIGTSSGFDIVDEFRARDDASNR